MSSPLRGTSGNDRAVTRCRRWLHETPAQRQKETLLVQLLARMPRGSESWALKASSASRSVVLPLEDRDGVRLGSGLGEAEEDPAAARAVNDMANNAGVSVTMMVAAAIADFMNGNLVTERPSFYSLVAI